MLYNYCICIYIYISYDVIVVYHTTCNYFKQIIYEKSHIQHTSIGLTNRAYFHILYVWLQHCMGAVTIMLDVH